MLLHCNIIEQAPYECDSASDLHHYLLIQLQFIPNKKISDFSTSCRFFSWIDETNNIFINNKDIYQ